MRLIDADALSESIKRGAGTDLQKFFADVCVATAPTVDAAIVTRCEDCVHWDDDPDTYGADDGPKGKCMKSFETMRADDFCSHGERKDGGDG